MMHGRKNIKLKKNKFQVFILKGRSKLTLESKYCTVKAEACTRSYPRK